MSTSSTSGTGTQPDPGPPQVQRHGIVLALIVSCELILMLDTTILNVALPSIKTGLGFSEANLSWVVNGFALAFGGLLLLGGRAGDILGRRATFVAGTSIFTVASLLGGLAPSAWWLVGARILQGVGAALAGPSTLSLLITHFEDGPRRTRALGVYSTVTGLGMALGLILGGVLTAAVSWRWVLFINVPIGIAVVLLAPRYLHESERNRGRFDLTGAVLSTVGMAGLVYGFVRTASGGLDTATTIVFVVAVLFLAGFVVTEARAGQPILPLRLFASRNRTGAYLAMLLVPATLFGMFFFMTQFLQDVKGLNALFSGLSFLPMALALFVAAQVIGKVMPKLGMKATALVGVGAVTLAVAWLSLLTPESAYVTAVLGPMILFGAGVGFTVVPLNMIIMGEVPAGDTGSASGALQAFQQIGGSLGLAILVTVFGSAIAGSGTGGAQVGRLPAAVQAAGTSTTFLAGTIFSLLAFVVLLVMLRIPAAPAAAAEPEEQKPQEQEADADR